MIHIKCFESFKPENDINDLIKYVENNSTLVLNNTKDDETLIFTTRANGDVGSETYSDIDYKECVELVKILKNKFPNFTYNIDTVDEWVNINATKKDFYKNYEPEPNRIGYVLSYMKKNGVGHAYESRDEYGTGSGIEKHRHFLKKICERFIIDKTPDEVLAIADSLPISKPFKYSEKVLIQKAHNSDDKKYETIPNADFYVQRREIW
jgi:hypothetical protein